jgi:hypothetical protein
MLDGASAEVAAWVSAIDDRHRATVDAIRAMVDVIAPVVVEFVYHDALGYSSTSSAFNRVAYVSVHRDHVTLGFMFGADLEDPDGFLSGSGKRMRHLKLAQPEDVGRPPVRRLVEQAFTAHSGRTANATRQRTEGRAVGPAG